MISDHPSAARGASLPTTVGVRGDTISTTPTAICRANARLAPAAGIAPRSATPGARGQVRRRAGIASSIRWTQYTLGGTSRQIGIGVYERPPGRASGGP